VSTRQIEEVSMKCFAGQFITLIMLIGAIGATSLAESAPRSEQTLTGTITCDARLTGQYACRKGQTLQSCTLSCVEQGFKYQLLVGQDTAYLLDGDHAQLEKFAGGKASVKGLVAAGENRIAVESVSKVAKKPRLSPSGSQ